MFMVHGKSHRINTINVRKKNLVQMRPLTAEIKNNKIPGKSVIRNKKNISRIRKNWCKVKCMKRERMGRNVTEV